MAFVVAILVIAFFMSYISKRSFLPFVIYRILLGGAIMVLLATGGPQRLRRLAELPSTGSGSGEKAR